MNSPSKIILDRFVAKPIAFLLNLAAWPLGKIISYDHSDSPEKVHTLAIAKLLGMGSILRATPMIRALKTKYPKARYLFITTLKNKALIERLELFDIHFYIRDSSLLNIFFDVLFLLPRLWHYKIDLYFDLEVYSAFSTIIATLSLARNRYGFYKDTTLFRKGLHTHLVYFNDSQRISKIYLQLARACGIKYTDTTIEKIKLSQSDSSEFDNWLRRKELSMSNKYIIINPNSSDLLLERRWPPNYFVTLIDALARNHSYNIFIVGSASERFYNNGIYDKLSKTAKRVTFNIAGEFSLGAVIVLISNAALMLTNDSGLYHIAISLNVPTISFWGPVNPYHYASIYDDKNNVIFYSPDIYCSPCLHKIDFPPCKGNNICLKSIAPKNVYQKACNIIGMGVSGDTKDMEFVYNKEYSRDIDITVKLLTGK